MTLSDTSYRKCRTRNVRGLLLPEKWSNKQEEWLSIEVGYRLLQLFAVICDFDTILINVCFPFDVTVIFKPACQLSYDKMDWDIMSQEF